MVGSRTREGVPLDDEGEPLYPMSPVTGEDVDEETFESFQAVMEQINTGHTVYFFNHGGYGGGLEIVESSGLD